MSKGIVKVFNDSKAFGFITEDDNNNAHVVYISGLIDEDFEGDLQEVRKGLNAVNAKVT